jgi:hypothetical protein
MTSPKIVSQMACALREVLYVKDHGEEIGEPLALQVAKALGAYEREQKAQADKGAKPSRPRVTRQESRPLVDVFGEFCCCAEVAGDNEGCPEHGRMEVRT